MAKTRKTQKKINRSFKFNKRSIEALPAHDKNSPSAEQEYNDSSCPGLKISVSKNNKKRFVHRYQIRKGRKTLRRCFRIGEFPIISVNQARDIVYSQRQELIIHGIDPQEKRQAKSNEITFSQFFENTYLPEYAMMEKKSWKSDLQRYNSDLKDEFGEMLLSEIKRSDIKLFLNKIKRRSSGANANRFRSLLSVVFSQVQEFISEDFPNPCSRLKKFRENDPREVYLELDEIGRLKAALDLCQERVSALLIWFLLCCGARLGEVSALTWKQINLEKKEAYLTNNMTKNGRRRLVILNDQAIATLNELKKYKKKNSPFVFPGRTNSFLKSPRKTWKKVKELACLDEEFHIHDLRHSHATLLASGEKKPSLYVISQLLGHQDPRQSKRYSHLFKDRLEEASASVSAQLDEATM